MLPKLRNDHDSHLSHLRVNFQRDLNTFGPLMKKSALDTNLYSNKYESSKGFEFFIN